MRSGGNGGRTTPVIHDRFLETEMSSKMSKRLGVSLALTFALLAIPTVVTTASAATAIKGHVVYADDGTVIGQDPDASIRLMLRRDPPDLGGNSND